MKYLSYLTPVILFLAGCNFEYVALDQEMLIGRWLRVETLRDTLFGEVYHTDRIVAEYEIGLEPYFQGDCPYYLIEPLTYNKIFNDGEDTLRMTLDDRRDTDRGLSYRLRSGCSDAFSYVEFVLETRDSLYVSESGTSFILLKEDGQHVQE